MTTRKPKPDKPARPAPPLAEKPAHKTSQADEAHIATAGYWRDQQVAIDRIAKLKALRLAQGDKAKPAEAQAQEEAIERVGSSQGSPEPPLGNMRS